MTTVFMCLATQTNTCVANHVKAHSSVYKLKSNVNIDGQRESFFAYVAYCMNTCFYNFQKCKYKNLVARVSGWGVMVLTALSQTPLLVWRGTPTPPPPPNVPALAQNPVSAPGWYTA